MGNGLSCHGAETAECEKSSTDKEKNDGLDCNDALQHQISLGDEPLRKLQDDPLWMQEVRVSRELSEAAEAAETAINAQVAKSKDKAKPKGKAKAAAPDDIDKESERSRQLSSDSREGFTRQLSERAKENSVFLANIKLFSRLPKHQLEALGAACEVIKFSPTATIVHQGDEGHDLFIVKSGLLSVSVNGKEVKELGKGDLFGETALLEDKPHKATIVCKGAVETLKLGRSQFELHGLKKKLVMQKRKAVGGGTTEASAAKSPNPKTPEERELMAAALRNNANLQGVLALSDTCIGRLIDVAWKETVPKGKAIITQGDIIADFFYIVQSGNFSITVTRDSAKEDTQSFPPLGEGGSFGELALLYSAPRAATVTAQQDCVVWVIARGHFMQVMAKAAEEYSEELAKQFDKVEVLTSLDQKQKKQLAKSLQEMNFGKDETIFRQGEKGETFYILVEGEVIVKKDHVEVAKLTGGQQFAFFGELALLNDAPRAATVKVVSKKAKTLMVDRQTFDMLLGPLDQIKNAHKSTSSKKPSAEPSRPKGANDGSSKIFMKDLKTVGLLGCGGFGLVELVEHQKTKETYALKGLSKGYVVETRMQKRVMVERDVQFMCNSPFIIKLHETFNSEKLLYFLLEAALGGELYTLYFKKNFFGNEALCKYYVAGIINAFDHFHGLKIVYRDLKPENLLINEQGHLKVTDMGLAKVVLGKTYTTCGTPDYFAPEVVSAAGHSHAADWWTLGVLAFELMTGNPPFAADTTMQIYVRIKAGMMKVVFPSMAKGPLEDFIKKLCKSDPADRLPMKKGGSANIKQHAWYKGFDWKSFDNFSMQPPYEPRVKSKTDYSNFAAQKEDMPPQIDYTDDGSGWDKDFATSGGEAPKTKPKGTPKGAATSKASSHKGN
eukprot:TRINITY_DN8307_c0_g1_i2.p1 TRINITY_DN8307_c0_g1~~TRINITY_DN8307_c0_g1_i2.p1  ORF type:complete len:895 (-),score=217.05 TRINITY_DN8307_c0_g1_i2:66-2750(-)